VRVLMVGSEAAPWSKTGGLADVIAALPPALEALGCDLTLVVPKYRGTDTTGADVRPHRLRHGAATRSIAWHVLPLSANRRVVFVEAPEWFERPGIYGEGGVDYADNATRFDLLAVAALEFAALNNPASWQIVHAHDWQASLVLLRLAIEPRWGALARAGRVLTIHNLAYQGVFARDTVPMLGLPWDAFRLERGEFWGQFSFLKSGITSADLVTTVSPTYAVETQSAAQGQGLDGVLRGLGSRYVGILNGIDTNAWDPANDPYLPARFSLDDLTGKPDCKRTLLAAVGLPQGDDALERPLIGMVSRLVAQKGLDLIHRAQETLASFDANYVFVGTGEPKYEAMLRAWAAAHPARVAARIGFDERLAHLVEAGADMFLMPSQFEPCGLNQMYSLRYGTVPIVTAVGGLHDTIQPYTARALHANGFKFAEQTPEMLARIVQRAIRLYHNPVAWMALMRNGMMADHSWSASATEYGKVYRRALAVGADRA
jgi:starch synthase